MSSGRVWRGNSKPTKRRSRFFDLAIAAPSMKAAAEAWGGNIEDFKRGFAKLTDDPELIAATMAKPGTVLKRPVGSSGAYTEHAKLPKHLAETTKEGGTKQQLKKKPQQTRALEDNAARAATLAFEHEQRRRETARRKEEAAREKKRRWREQALAKAESALALATRRHATRSNEIERQRVALERRSQAEEARWEKEKEKLRSAVRRAGE